MNDAVFKLRVPTSELETWRNVATSKGVSLAEWIRGQCNANGTTDKDVQRPAEGRILRRRNRTHKPDTGSVATIVVPTNEFCAHKDVPTSQLVPTVKRMCPHHHQRGELCYKCDSKFGQPALS
jgi:hypothetical protein